MTIPRTLIPLTHAMMDKRRQPNVAEVSSSNRSMSRACETPSTRIGSGFSSRCCSEATNARRLQVSREGTASSACEATFLHRQFANALPGGIMFAAHAQRFQIVILLAAGLAALMLPTQGRAYTMGAQAACGGDAFRLCGAEIPNVDRITACMIRHRSQLSPRCQAFFRRGRGRNELTVDPPRRHWRAKPVIRRRDRWHKVRGLRADAN